MIVTKLDVTSLSHRDVPPAHVQAKWHQLKVCYVPNWKAKCFGGKCFNLFHIIVEFRFLLYRSSVFHRVLQRWLSKNSFWDL